MDFFLQFLIFLITVLVLVTIHEAGHFAVAKALGIKVLRFSVGFGKSVWRRVSRSGTEYVIAVIPLGGYVKLLDEREGPVVDSEKHLAFNRQPLWARTIVVLAGPLTNFIFAIVAFWLMYVIGVETIKPVVGKVIPHSIAAASGIQSGEQIIKVNNEEVKNWQPVVLTLLEHVGDKRDHVVLETKDAAGKIQKRVIQLNQWRVDPLNPEPLQSLGLIPYYPKIPPIIHGVVEGGPADQAGLRSGDQIIKVDGQVISDWITFVRYVHARPGQTIQIIFKRDNQLHNTKVMIEKKLGMGFRWYGQLGVLAVPTDYPPEMKHIVKYSWTSALAPAWQETWSFFVFNFVVLKKMIKGELSLQSLGGPISIFRTANLAFRQGAAVFLGFLALISIMLAFVNILPIPGLDGGHLLNYLIESIIRRPIPPIVEMVSIRIGIVLLILLMLQATMNDILRLFQ